MACVHLFRIPRTRLGFGSRVRVRVRVQVSVSNRLGGTMMSRVICVTQPVQVSVAGISASEEPRCLSPRCHVSGESVSSFGS
jgi:hypothetical protein